MVQRSGYGTSSPTSVRSTDGSYQGGSWMPVSTATPASSVLDHYTAHYNRHRSHRSLGQRPPAPRSQIPNRPAAKVQRRPVLDGLINEYVQAA